MTASQPSSAGSAAARGLLGLVGFYRRWLSPLKRTPSCRYLPTCSEYAAQAIVAHGAARGAGLAAARVLRCNPLFHGGYDPVPATHEGSCCHG